MIVAMKSLIGLLYSFGGAAIGFGVGIVAALVIAKLADVSARDGASGYITFGIGLVGALVGLAAGMALYARSAPAGQAAAYSWSAVLGVAGVAGVLVLGAWAYLNLSERPLEYDGAMATLEMELRIDGEHAPADSSQSWLRVEVHTGNARPEGDVRWSAVRTEGAQRIVPVSQNPLMRATGRTVVVSLAGRPAEIFVPPMPRTPDSRADWSAWYRPQRVEAASSGSDVSRAVTELRYRVRRYGE